MPIDGNTATTAGTAVCQCSDLNSIEASKYLVYKLNDTIIHTSTAVNSGTFYGRFMSQGTSGVKATASATNKKYTWTMNTNPSMSADGYYGLNDSSGSDWGSLWGFYTMSGVLWVSYALLEGAGNYVGSLLPSNHTLVSGDVMTIEYAD